MNQLEYYNEKLTEFGDDYPDPLVKEIAAIISPDWWTELTQWTDESHPVHVLDNYPGQHLGYRRRSYEKALIIVGLLDARYQPRNSPIPS